MLFWLSFCFGFHGGAPIAYLQTVILNLPHPYQEVLPCTLPDKLSSFYIKYHHRACSGGLRIILFAGLSELQLVGNSEMSTAKVLSGVPRDLSCAVFHFLINRSQFKQIRIQWGHLFIYCLSFLGSLQICLLMTCLCRMVDSNSIYQHL